MSRSAPSGDETEHLRIAKLRALMVLDTEPEPIFDSLTSMASRVCGTPVALLSLLDTGRQWFKSNVGLTEVSQTPREVAFCEHTILGDKVMQVADASRDPRFAQNPLVLGPAGMRFYAGSPLVMSTGERIGTLCVMDRVARELNEHQMGMLKDLAKLAAQALEMRERLIVHSLAARSEHERTLAESETRLRSILDAQRELVSQSMPDGRLIYVNPAYAAHLGRSAASIVGTSLFEFIPEEDRQVVQERIHQVLRTGERLITENRTTGSEGEEHWVSWTNTRQINELGEVFLHSTGRDVTDHIHTQRLLHNSQALLERTGRLAGVGGWEVDIPSTSVTWTSETRRIHEVSPDYQPTLARALDFYSETSRPVIEAAVQRGQTEGAPWDLEVELITATGRRRWARAVGEVEFDAGIPARMFGAIQDITERRTAQQMREEISAIFEHSSDFIIQADQQRRVLYMNPAAAKSMLGRAWASGEELLVRDLLPVSAQTKFVEEILPALERTSVWVGQSLAYLVGRKEIPVSHMAIAHRDTSGNITRYSVILRDVSALVAAQVDQERQASTLRSLANAIPSTVAVVDREGRYVFVNRAFEQAVGMDAEAVHGQTARHILGEAEFGRRWPWIQRAQAGERVHFELEQDRSGSPKDVAVDYLPLASARGEPDGFVVVVQDITQQKKEREQLKLLSRTDPLTGLLNRAGFEQRLHNLLTDHLEEPIAVLFVDLDRFKAVNDNHGHAMGDEVLRWVAKRLVRLVRPTDTIARLGGDEFTMVLPGLKDLALAMQLADTVVDAMSEPFGTTGGVQVRIGASVGGTLGQATRSSWPELLRLADQMLYKAKQAGRNCSRVAAAPVSKA